jgi:hypothetical protein
MAGTTSENGCWLSSPSDKFAFLAVLLSVMSTPSLRRLIDLTAAFELALVVDSVSSTCDTIRLLSLQGEEKMDRIKTHNCTSVRQ